MADVGALRLLGAALGAATLAVALIAAGTVIAAQQHAASPGPVGNSVLAQG